METQRGDWICSKSIEPGGLGAGAPETRTAQDLGAALQPADSFGEIINTWEKQPLTFMLQLKLQ